MMQSRFVHLRIHSEYSLVDGLLRIDTLFDAISKRGMDAVALTDFCNLFAVVKFYKQALAASVKPIIGADLPCCFSDAIDEPCSMLMLCQNEIGYRNLTRLVSKAFQEGQYQGKPRVYYEWIEQYADGLIVLSGGCHGDIGKALKAQDITLAEQIAKKWMTIFPNRYYLEIQRTGREFENEYNSMVVSLANRLHIPLVATNDVCFLDKEDFEAHEARICIHDGYTLADPRRSHKYSHQQYFRSADEMVALFHDLPEAVQNTIEISKRCTVAIELGHNYLPNFPTPQGISVEEYLSALSHEGLNARLQQLFGPNAEEKRPIYLSRLEIEIKVINEMGFAGYFLIVADFIKWALENGVPVGPGRGSGAGSLVAYSLRITDLDPLAYELLFERFLNPERVSMPDFDIDFCMEGRDRVIDYVAEKYGRQSVSQIITFGTMAAKAVVRDVGRVLGHPYGFVDKIAKLIPFEIGMTLTKALEQSEELQRRFEDEEEVNELLQLALKLEGITRNAGKHAGGVVIAPSELTDFSAIYCEEGSTQIVSQLDKDDVEAVGLVKFDFLGLRTLTIINWALHTINQNRSQDGEHTIDIGQIPLDCKEVFDLLKQCQTTAVFQLESRGMKELIHRLQPDTFEEIIALVALFRPGPLQSGMVDDFIDRKHGRARVEYLHPDLEPILKATYGVILYQEQVMQIAQVLANYTLGAADLLRRAMGKKKPEEMAKQRQIFTDGASARGIDSKISTMIFDLMEKFAGYGFNKSHSAAYALVAYQTAWLKAYYPAAFMASVLSSDMDNTDKVVIFVNECKQMQIKILPPAINQSQYKFTVGSQGEIVYGLGAIKGVGEAVVQSIVTERETRGPYENLFQLCERLDLRKLNRRVLETLIKSGAFDEWGQERATLFESLDKAMQVGTQCQHNSQSGQQDLFSLIDEERNQVEYVSCPAWSELKRLAAEKETLGYYLSGHPVSDYRHEFKSYVCAIANLNPQITKKSIVCGLITSFRTVLTKRGKKLVIISLEDGTGKIDVLVFPEQFSTELAEFAVGKIVLIEGELAIDDFNGGVRMTATALYTTSSFRQRFAKCLRIHLNMNDKHHLPELQATLTAYRGGCVVQVCYSNESASAVLSLAQTWCVIPSDQLIEHLTLLLGRKRVEMFYD